MSPSWADFLLSNCRLPRDFKLLRIVVYPGQRWRSSAHAVRTQPESTIVEKTAGPHLGFVLPEMGEGLLQVPGPCGGQFAGEQGIQLLPGSPAHPAAAA